MDQDNPSEPAVQPGAHQYSSTSISGSARVHLGDHVGDIHHHHSHGAPVERAESPPSPSSTVPFRRDTDFIDRGTLLTEIEQKCTEGGSRVALVGIGGVGKSQLAIEYCHRLRQRSPDTWVFWVYASSGNRVTQGFREIAEEVKIPDRNDPQANVFNLVKKWLRNEKRGNWLLVLDNLDNDAVLTLQQEVGGSTHPQPLGSRSPSLLDYLPQTQNGMILFTTRTMDVAHQLVEPRDTITINPMNETDATQLLAKKLNGHTADYEDLKELVTVLEFMPLAIVQAAAYIDKRAPRCSVRHYIDEFSQSDQARISLLTHDAGHLRRDPEAKNSIIITWQISFEYIQERWPSAADLLSLMSFFDRQGIPEYVLKAPLQEHNEIEGDKSATSGNETFETDLDRLREYSFVSVEVDGHTFTMHRMVQLTMRAWLVQHKQDREHRSVFLRKLHVSYPTGEHENWMRCEALLPHARVTEEQPPDPSLDDVSVYDWSRILCRAAWYCKARGNYGDAERMCNKSVKALEERLEPGDIKLTHSRGLLASVYAKQGRWWEAEVLEVRVLDIFKRVLGAEHPETLISMNNLALIYWHQERLGEAEELTVQVLNTSKRVRMLGAEHPHTLVSMSNLVAIYRTQERWAKVEELEAQLLDTQRRVLGTEHPGTLISMSSQTITYMKRGRWTEGEQLAAQVLEIRKRVLGVEHPSTLSSMHILARFLKYLQRDNEGIALMTSCLQLRTKKLGPTHPDTQMSQYWLMEFLRSPVQQQDDEMLY